MGLSRRNLLVSAAGLGLCLPGVGTAFASDQGPILAQDAIRTLVDDYLTRLSGFGYSGAALLARNGEILVHGGYGLADDARRIPVAADTVFDIGSMAKTFTAVAMLRLVAQNRVRLEDRISLHLADVPEDKSGITVEQLLGHTSGLAREFPFENPIADDYEEVSREEALKRIYATPMDHAPGEHFAYSNIGFILAAAIVETAGGRPFHQVLRDEIFEPLGLSATGFWGDVLPGVSESRLARGYADGREIYRPRDRSGTTWADRGGGQMVSRADDLHAFLQALREDRLLPPALRERMWTPGQGGWGLGWSIEADAPGGRRIHHGGDTTAFGAELAWYPDIDLVLVNLTNRTQQVLGTRYAADRVIPQLIQGQTPHMWPNQPFDIPPRWSPDGDEALEAFAGTYRLSSGSEFLIRKRSDGVFRISARGQDAIDALMPASEQQRATRARSTERALAMLRAVSEGDMETLTATLRHGAPVEGYHNGLSRTLKQDALGALLSIEPVGTAPFGFPVLGRQTVLKLTFEKGQDYLGFTWDPGEDRIRNMGGGPPTLAATPLHPARDTPGVVGWNIIGGRSLFLDTSGLSGPDGVLALTTTDGARVLAVRDLGPPPAAP